MNSTLSVKEFHVVTTLGLHDRFVKEPFNNALAYHLNNKGITRIHILTESSADNLIAALPVLKDDRISLISVPRRPVFEELLDYCNGLANSESLTVSLMNADTSFAGDADIERCLTTLDACRERGLNAVLNISRCDKRGEQFGLFLRDQTGLPNFVSADCWVFHPPLKPIDIDYFAMGQMNCDLILTFSLTESGQTLLNPCVDISVIHHEHEEKSDSFYQEENLKKPTRDLLSRHWARKCVIPYHYYGVLWNRVEWIKHGYLPAPIKDFGKKRIYLFVAGTMTDKFEQHLLFLTEIISRCNDFDLIVMGEDVYEINTVLVGKIGFVSRNTYFVQVDSVDEVSSNLISESDGRHESIAWIANFGLLTPKLLKEFHAVILDIRHCNSVRSVNVPSGHTEHLHGIIIERYGIEVDEQFVFEPQPDQAVSCTLVTSLYKSDSYILGFRENITALDGYENYVHVILFSKLSELEKETLISWRSQHPNVILGHFQNDPGLYECWNIGIRLAPTEYISNANVDDLRHPSHVDTLLECLHKRPSVAVASTALIAFEEYTAQLEDIDSSQPWFADEAGEFGMDKLAKLEKDEHGHWMLVPNNIPHCMPVWRKAVHNEFGYFDESRFGTFADWAFWLKVTKSGEKGFLDERPLAYYFINASSHNRRGDKLKQFHQEVECEFLDTLYFREMEGDRALLTATKFDSVQSTPRLELPRKLHLSGLNQSFGEHRNSFNRLIESLLPLHNKQGGIEFIPFIERYFVWGSEDGEAASSNPRPIQKDWIGILHVPFDAPEWFEFSTSPEAIFFTELWKASLPFCRGIICLSEDLRQDLACWYPDIPSFSLKFPTVLDVKPFVWESYESRPRLVQVGDWLRCLQGIYEISAPGHEKVMLMKRHTAVFLNREIEAIGDARNDTVKVLDYVGSQEYDDLLCSSVVFCMLYATSANNVVTECLARGTPMLVNPLPSVIEYLGAEYPLYVTNIAEASLAVSDLGRVRAAYQYLDHHVDLREALDYDRFAYSMGNSDFYANL